MKQNTKQTHYRMWKSGKLWLYGASVLLLAGVPLLPAAVPIVGVIQAAAQTVTENGASLTVPDKPVDLFVNEQLTAEQFGVSASGEGVSAPVISGLHPETPGSQTASASVPYSYTKTNSTTTTVKGTPIIVSGQAQADNISYNGNGTYTNTVHFKYEPADAKDVTLNCYKVWVNTTDRARYWGGLMGADGATAIAQFKKLAAAFGASAEGLSVISLPNNSTSNYTPEWMVMSIPKSNIPTLDTVTSVLNSTFGISGVPDIVYNYQNTQGNGSFSGTSVAPGGSVNEDAPQKTINGEIYQPLTIFIASSPDTEDHEVTTETTEEVAGELKANFPVNYHARPELTAPKDVTMFASDVLKASDTKATVTDELAEIDNGKLTAHLISSKTDSDSDDSGKVEPSKDSSDSSSSDGSIQLPAGSKGTESDDKSSELKYHDSTAEKSETPSDTENTENTDSKGVVDELEKAEYKAATGEVHTSESKDQLTAPGTYVIAYDYTYKDPVLGTEQKLHKEQTITVYPDPIITAPADLKLMRSDQLVKQDATVEDVAKDIDKGKLTADYSKVDTSVIGVYPVLFTYTYHDPYTDEDKTATVTQHVEIVDKPVLNVKPAVTLYVGDKFDINEERYQYVLSDVMQEYDQGAMLDPVVNVDTSKVGSYTITWSYKYVNEAGSWQTISGTQDVYVIAKDIKASVKYTDTDGKDLTPKSPIPTPEGKIGDEYKILTAPEVEGYDFVKVTFNDKDIKVGDTVTLEEDNQLIYQYKKVEEKPVESKKVTIKVLPHTGEDPTPWILTYGGIVLVAASLGVWKRKAIAKLFGKILKRGN